jgi:ubiquinone/menaquinone biosynthesis C-methylase UbiE
MVKNISEILDTKKLYLDKNGIWVCKKNKYSYDTDTKDAWEKIYNYNLDELKKSLKVFNESKMNDLVKYIKNSYNFTDQTIYLEIGCGPSYLGNYLIKNYDIYFVGIDFNYKILLSLKNYFDINGYKKYILICDDINNMPIKNNCIDYIYGGGVIEHFPDTGHILKHSFRVLKEGGVSFNTIPAFNISWILRFYRNIPNLKFLKEIFEYIHITILKNKILRNCFGYELSFTRKDLVNLHKNAKFNDINVGNFVFHANKSSSLKNFINNFLYILMKINFLSPIYYVEAKK